MKTIKIFKLILILIILFSFNNCVNQKQKDEDQIKKTVKNYWKAVKENNLEEYKNLFEEKESFDGGIQGEFYFLHDNYEKINSNDILLKKIKIKDTVGLAPSIKLKYVQFIIEKKNDSNNLKKDLIITLTFYKPVGYNKIFNPSTLENHIGWNEN
ncbi:hypothetical protein [Chryseobacterium sp. 'Rf worker isolate 10']|uniref:hypothetical protein n=1 Tax=Chryseobacterium sp. 'Rf worker isolate 10' TaxID=2887348 RepID=UPI003D6E9DCA